MYVTCERCNAEYDFDDALVSARGTKVECTQCNHQFRVRRSDVAESPTDTWSIRTLQGQEVLFGTLGALQRAIADGRLSREDVLARGAARPRRLGSVPELEPFFAQGAAGAPSMGGSNSLRRSHPPEAASTKDASVVMPLAAASGARATPASPLPVRRFAPTPLPPPARRGVPTEGSNAIRPVFITPSEPMRIDYPALTPTPSDVAFGAFHGRRDSAGAASASASLPVSRAAPMRWVGTVVVAGGLLLSGAVIGKRFIAPYAVPRSVQSVDARLLPLLEDAKRRLAEGDLDAAKENLDKASVLAERDTAVAREAARLAVTRADFAWLRTQLTADDPDQLVARRDFEDLLARAARALAAVRKLVPKEDADLLRLSIDEARLRGEIAAARELVKNLPATDEENGLVLAALDLAEPNPSFPTIIDRLRLAATREQNLGRARSLLVYCLARSQDLDGAKKELERLAKAPRPNALVPALRSYLSKAESAAGLNVTGAGPGGGSSTESGEPTDPREILRAAKAAAQKGDGAKAGRLYQAVLNKNASDPEALCGLADIARGRGEATQAEHYYNSVLADNAGYLPALAGLADLRWQAGDHTQAWALYRKVLERGEGSPYAERARERLTPNGGASAPESPGKSAASPIIDTSDLPVAPSRATPHAAPSSSEIDTSDLPGYAR